MKTFSTEKHNIPEGATGYREQGQYIEWFSGSNGNWRLIKSNVPSLAMCDALLPIIPIPQHEVEWNGEGLPPVGVKCIFTRPDFKTPLKVDEPCEVLMHTDNNGFPVAVVRQYIGTSMVVDFAGSDCFMPIETPQQREERERLEAAYDLYLAFWSASKSSIILESFKEFSWGGNSDLKHFLAIVDKTNYRKESN